MPALELDQFDEDQVDELRLLAQLVDHDPEGIAKKFLPGMRARVSAAVPGHDAAVALQANAARYLAEWCGRVPTVFDEVEVGVFCDRYAREPRLRVRLRHGLTWWKFRRFIRRLVDRFDQATVVSDLEREHLRAIGCDVGRITVVPNGIEVPPVSPPAVRVPRLVYPGSVTYSAAIERAATRDADPDASAFAQRVRREAQRRGFDHAARRVVLGDGAPWIWNLAEEHFPGALQIVDRFHAKQHLSDVTKALYGPMSDVGRAWAQQRHAELDAGDLAALRRVLTRAAPRCDEARTCGEYLERNHARVRYPLFHAQGLCTSTGVVEAGCKVAIGTRLKRAGMHWTAGGANAILALRCCRLSGRFEVRLVCDTAAVRSNCSIAEAISCSTVILAGPTVVL